MFARILACCPAWEDATLRDGARGSVSQGPQRLCWWRLGGGRSPVTVLFSQTGSPRTVSIPQGSVRKQRVGLGCRSASSPEWWVWCQRGFEHSPLLFALSLPSSLQPGKPALEGYKPDTNLPAEPSVWPFPCSFYPSFKSLTGVFRSNKPYVKDVKEQIFCRLYQHAESEGKRAIMLGEGGRSDYLGVIIREGNSGRCCEWQGFAMGHKSLKAKPLGSI